MIYNIKQDLFKCFSQDVTAPVSDLLEGWSKLEFYGQRPWRPGKHSLEPPEQQREAEGIKVVFFFLCSMLWKSFFVF